MGGGRMSTMSTRVWAGEASCHEGDESNNLAEGKESHEHHGWTPQQNQAAQCSFLSSDQAFSYLQERHVTLDAQVSLMPSPRKLHLKYCTRRRGVSFMQGADMGRAE